MKNKTKVVAGKWKGSEFIADKIVGYTTHNGYRKAAKMLGCDGVQIHMTTLGHSWVPIKPKNKS